MFKYIISSVHMPVTETPPVECVEECPYFKSARGTCGHDLKQDVMKHFVDNPGALCPIFKRWRARQMADLAQELEETYPHGA